MNCDELRRGVWITFHRRPVYGPHCHGGCDPKRGGHGGYAEVGQITGRATALFWGRRVYRVRYWHPRPNGHLDALDTEVSADRVIAHIQRPPGWEPLITPESRSPGVAELTRKAA